MRFRTIVLSLAVASAGVAVAACGGDGGDESNKVFVAAPWDGDETLTYSLEQEGVDNEAMCTLSTELGDAGEVILARACVDDRGYRDLGRVTADNESLEPIDSMREVFDVEEDRTTIHSVRYEGREAHFETRSEGEDDSRTTSRDLPEPTEDSPTPGWYDDESLLWLVRGIELREGYEDHYTHVINAGQPRVLSADLEVQEREDVEVPAGTFTTWRVRVSSGGIVYRFWVDE
ncbi:MAG: hypothetical protein WED87_03170, partial [Dehalococcoidia bacterium]